MTTNQHEIDNLIAQGAAAAQAEADRHARRAARFYREETNAVTLTRIADALEAINNALGRLANYESARMEMDYGAPNTDIDDYPQDEGPEF